MSPVRQLFVAYIFFPLMLLSAEDSIEILLRDQGDRIKRVISELARSGEDTKLIAEFLVKNIRATAQEIHITTPEEDAGFANDPACARLELSITSNIAKILNILERDSGKKVCFPQENSIQRLVAEEFNGLAAGNIEKESAFGAFLAELLYFTMRETGKRQGEKACK